MKEINMKLYDVFQTHPKFSCDTLFQIFRRKV